MIKRVVALLVAVAISFVVVPCPCGAQVLPSSNFPDVPAGTPLADALAELAARGVVSGYPDGYFHPDDPINRAQLIKMLVMLLYPGEIDESNDNDNDVVLGDKSNRPIIMYTNVPAWALPYARVAMKHGWVVAMEVGREKGYVGKGYVTKDFCPDETVTGAQLASVLVCALKLTEQVPMTTPWYAGYVAAAREAGLLWENFNPQAPVTRAQCALTLAKALKILKS